MNILIIGHGNMGSRYKSIIQGHQTRPNVFVLDKFRPSDKQSDIDKADKVIITTPTDYHEDYIQDYLDKNIPILCEKPLTKNIKFLKEIQNHKNIKKLKMVNNWEYALRDAKKSPIFDGTGKTLYNYHYSGNDGLAWDCIQLIYLSKNKYSFSNKSSIFRAQLNGFKIDPEHIQLSYYYMIDDFLDDKMADQDFNKIIDAHEKAEAINHAYTIQERSNRHSTTTQEHSTAI